MLRLMTATALVSALAVPALARDLTVASANMISNFDPASDHSNIGSQFYFNSFDPLIHKDYSTSEVVFTPGLATEWTMVDDVTMELKLREGVVFHNGDAMTADDVVFSLMRMFQADFPPYQVRMKDRFANFDRAEKVDDLTVRVISKRPDPLFETLLNLQQLVIVPKAYTMSLAGDPDALEHDDYEAFRLKPVGTGPYRVAEYIPGQRLVWERFDGFWGEPAPLDRVNVIHVPEVSARLTALRTGEADIATNIAPDQLALIEADPSLKAVGGQTPLFHMMILNQNHPKLQDPRIRQAMILAVDRDLLNEALWLGKAHVPPTHTMEEFGALYMPELQSFEYNPEKAKQLLAEAGYDGFEITFDTQGSYYTNGLLATQAITEMWREVGINAAIRDLPAWSGNDPEMMARNWSNPMYFADPVGSFGMMWAPHGPSQGEGRFNTDEAYADMWDQFRFSADTEARKAAYAELMAVNTANPAFMPLYRPYESWAMPKSILWAPKPGHIPYVLDFRAGSIAFEGQ